MKKKNSLKGKAVRGACFAAIFIAVSAVAGSAGSAQLPASGPVVRIEICDANSGQAIGLAKVMLLKEEGLSIERSNSGITEKPYETISAMNGIAAIMVDVRDVKDIKNIVVMADGYYFKSAFPLETIAGCASTGAPLPADVAKEVKFIYQREKASCFSMGAAGSEQEAGAGLAKIRESKFEAGGAGPYTLVPLKIEAESSK